jgi:hypothetical protein
MASDQPSKTQTSTSMPGSEPKPRVRMSLEEFADHLEKHPEERGKFKPGPLVMNGEVIWQPGEKLSDAELDRRVSQAVAAPRSSKP